MIWNKKFLKKRINYIFGTNNIWRALLPSNRKLTYNPVNFEEDNTGILMC